MKKEPIKVNISTVFLILAIIVIIIMGYYIYHISTQNKENINSLNTEISNLKNSIKDYQETINNISNTLNLATSNNTSNTIGNSSSTNVSSSKYSKITKSLENEDVLLVTDAINNNNGTYTLRGEISEVDTSKEQTAEFPFRKKTGEYKEITVSSNTKCVYHTEEDIGETKGTEIDTVENVFSKKLYNNAPGKIGFNFDFENGKCISVYTVIIGH